MAPSSEAEDAAAEAVPAAKAQGADAVAEEEVPAHEAARRYGNLASPRPTAR